ncbi:hypothetical protein ACH79_42800 [Bradyrhizobium sp. CCBAU 051011]|uniref:hypothetical protein n=1 Tax=Bradyrhizobium sp. CCBAU 051011 TaxID=858422 RepID=UPI00137395E1|nr:hypothetical protein [Bradyrhizobium sp. CCBAU 051011]QHO78324.1 hypothetical protein ACH79_42800 [Bradyrhizobium sp. CCBAU 051011]
MTKETYTVKARNCEYRAAKPTLESALAVAREKVWPIAPDERVQVYRGKELVGEITSDVGEGGASKRAA